MRPSFVAVITILSLSGCAALSGHEGHASHGAGSPSDSVRYDNQMHSMAEVHQKMKAAKTPEERRALMAEHMRAMRGGMRMMCEMNAGASSGTMKRCMDMHDMTVKMMTDREGAASAR